MLGHQMLNRKSLSMHGLTSPPQAPFPDGSGMPSASIRRDHGGVLREKPQECTSSNRFNQVQSAELLVS